MKRLPEGALFVPESVDFPTMGSAFGGAFQVVMVANAERPWFPFYARDWMTDVQVRLMSLECRGAYLELLCLQWENGSIPDRAHDLAVYLGYESIDSGVHFQATIWPMIDRHFPVTKDGQTRQNPRLEKEKIIADRVQGGLSARGTKAVKERWRKYRERQDNHTRVILNDTPSPSPSPSHPHPDEEKKKHLPRSETRGPVKYPTIFEEEFWAAYPKRNGVRVGKKATLRRWKQVPEDDRPLLAQAVKNYERSRQARDGKARDPERFLKDDHWRDWVASSGAADSSNDDERTILILALQGRRFGETTATKDGLEGPRGPELWGDITIERLRKMSDASRAF